MKNGNWIPISKAFLKHLPLDREYTKLEAIFSLQVSFDRKEFVTVAGLASIWRWSRKKVNRFLENIGVYIIYSENTSKKQNQKGQIGLQIRDRSGTDKGQIRFIDYSNLPKGRNRKRTDKGQIRDRSGSTTKDPNPNPNPNLKKETYKKKEKFAQAAVNSISEQTQNSSVWLYNFYIEKIDPLNKSRQRCLKNLQPYLKDYSLEDLKQSILNYSNTALERDRVYRKDPANFFGKNEKYFQDYLPENFKGQSTPEGAWDNL